MEYIYKMSKEMYQETEDDAKKLKYKSIADYITDYFGLYGKCVKVEIV